MANYDKFEAMYAKNDKDWDDMVAKIYKRVYTDLKYVNPWYQRYLKEKPPIPKEPEANWSEFGPVVP